MKRIVYIIAIIALGFWTACEKDAVEPKENNVTNQVAKVIEIYNEEFGKTETILIEGTKIETTANIDLDSLRLALDAELKSFLMLKSEHVITELYSVGVIKSGSCGLYTVLYIYSDDEDSNNNNYSTGWIGDFSSTTNTKMSFCIIPNANERFWRGRTYDYALLRVHFEHYSKMPDGWLSALRGHDSENSSPGSKFLIHYPTDPPATTYDITFNKDIYPTLITPLGRDLRPQFYYITKDPINGYDGWPNLDNISYGVFGKVSATRGEVYMDDEDEGNRNIAEVKYWNPSRGVVYYDAPMDSLDNSGIIQGRGNTKYFLSKVR